MGFWGIVLFLDVWLGKYTEFFKGMLFFFGIY